MLEGTTYWYHAQLGNTLPNEYCDIYHISRYHSTMYLTLGTELLVLCLCPPKS